MLAFFGLLRVNEYMNGGLRHRHVRPHPQGVSITIPYSKTDLSEVTIDIARRGDDLCPSRALAQYFAFFAAHSSLPQLPDDPLFITRQQYAFATMTDGDFLSVVRSYIRALAPSVGIVFLPCLINARPGAPPAQLNQINGINWVRLDVRGFAKTRSVSNASSRL
jgi:hypothetical protein